MHPIAFPAKRIPSQCSAPGAASSVPAWLAGDGGLDALVGWICLVSSLPAVCYSAQSFFAGAWRGLGRGMADMDLPVAPGIGVGFAGSSAALPIARAAPPRSSASKDWSPECSARRCTRCRL